MPSSSLSQTSRETKLAMICLFLAFGLVTPALAGTPQAALKTAAIASPDLYGAKAAREVLKKGGNAVDAAVATAFALAVTYPEAGNIGGGGFMTLVVDGKPYFLDYRETAPQSATAGMYLDAKGEPIAELSEYGALSAGIPGTVMGLYEAHKRFGKLPWATDIAPAIRYARNGFTVTKQLADLTKDSETPFIGVTNFKAYYSGLTEGTRLRQPELATTLQAISDKGSDGFYKGVTADRIVAQMAKSSAPGIITHADLAAYKVKWRDPIIGDWRSVKGETFQVITAPPPSSGGIALLQMLAMKADAAPLFKDVPLNSVQYIHLVAEIEKRVFADRAQYLGDPDFVTVPVDALTAPAYLQRRAASLNPLAPTPTASVLPGLELPAEKPQTTHFSIVDRWGNAVSNTYTLNGWFGSGVVVEGAGFLLNDEMDDFSAKPGAPNMYGVVGGDANAIAPDKRPLSSMTPTILMRNGKVAMVLGTPGGSRIFTSVFQVLANVYDFGKPLPEALQTLRFHHQLLPANTLFAEPYAPFPADLAAQLQARGYVIENQDFNGDIEAIQIIGNTPHPSADPRARGVAMTVP